MRVIAEGVETEEQLGLPGVTISATKIRVIHSSKPISTIDIEKLIKVRECRAPHTNEWSSSALSSDPERQSTPAMTFRSRSRELDAAMEPKSS